MPHSVRLRAAFETCETLLAPGKKWRLSPYVDPALSTAGMSESAFLIPVYQSVVLDLLVGGHLSSVLSVLDVGSPAGIAALATLDALLAWHTTCTLYDVSSGVNEVDVWAVNSKSQDGRGLWRSFRDAVQVRAETLPELGCLSLVAGWARDVSTPLSRPPNLVFLSLPWEQSIPLEPLLDKLPTGAVVVAIDWESSGSEDNVFRWRYELLRRRDDLVALGPCGQEYGRELPEACLTCFHGRREKLHCPNTNQNQTAPAWTYAILAKQTTPAESPSHALVSAEVLAQVVTDDVHLRYIGTVRERVISADHPDEASDNPNDQEWREYLRVCPGYSGATRVAIERRAGMQTPRLRYGQWLHVRDLQPQRPYANYPDIYVLRARDEAAFHTVEGLPVADTFISSYTSAVRAAVDEACYRLFRFPDMRDFQHTILARGLCGRDILAIAATGGGKSECYILPAMLLPGITVVVSPLKSLILDQYEQRMRDRYGLDYLTTFINSDVPFYERQGRLRRTILGHFKLVYMTPEQLERGYVLDALRQADRSVGLRYLAMDEAHCISQWGHDFRPSYLNIVQRLQDYGLKPCRIAVTATASPLVRDDVCNEMCLDQRDLSSGGDVFIDSSNRPELNLVVRRVRTAEEKARIIVESLRQLNDQGSAIVFMPHTGGTPERPRDLGAPRSDPKPENAGMVSPGVTPFARYLSQQIDQPIAMYHGALDDEASPGRTYTSDTKSDSDNVTTDAITRQAEQRGFMADRKRIMVATKGFGMGVDKPDIRLVIHRSPTANLEAYVQEAGRAGRDGKPATVMLLASDDRPEIANVLPDTYLGRTSLPSDREIQQFFIEQRYVRPPDVAAMLAFLRSDRPQRVNGALYFTNDQVMGVFDQCATQPAVLGLGQSYEWPSFPPRKISSRYESSDHRHILDTGYLYKRKRDHIGRILAVLFNNRPTIDGHLLPLVRLVHETGTLLRQFQLYKPERIVESLAYFGEKLRQAGVSTSELRSLLPGGERTDLTPLASRLGISLREMASMLRDIHRCEGRTKRDGHWIGTLLNFWWIEAPRWVSIPDAYTNLAAWRSHAGARRRVKPPSGRQSLNDYFPWQVVNKPSGWEVFPDVGLQYPDSAAYLDAFMTLHDERRRNDENNFAYLLDRYVGSEDGTHECLRSLVLGYLKTNEVVVGGKCYGCSVCVPDLDFDRYPLAMRRQAVTRMMPETIALMNQVEAGNRDTPMIPLLDQALDAVAREDAQGRSGTAYLDSWLARLIQDDPEHQGALWLRLHALERDVLSLSPQDLLTAIERLVRLTTTRENMPRLQSVIEHYLRDPRYRALQLPLTVQAAELASRQKEWTDEAALWHQVLDLTESARQGTPGFALLRRALARLLALYQQGGRLPDKRRSAEVGGRLARLPGGSLEEAQAAYSAAVHEWRWRQVEAELSMSKSAHPAAALLAWLDTSPATHHKAVLKWLESAPAVWSHWTVEVLQAVDERLASDLDKIPELLLTMADATMHKSGGEALSTQYLLRAWAGGTQLSPSQLRHVATYLTKLDGSWCKKTLGRQKRTTTLLTDLWKTRGGRDFPLTWLQCFQPKVIRELPDDVLSNLLKTWSTYETPLDAKLLTTIAARMIRSDGKALLATVTRLATQRPELATQLLSACLTTNEIQPMVAQALFPVLLQDRSDQRAVVEILDKLSANPAFLRGTAPVARVPGRDWHSSLERDRALPEETDLVSLCLDNWTALRADMDTWPLLRRYRIEGSTLVGVVTKWLSSISKPHRMDMLVVILRDVQRRSSASWLTPVSLEFQALCAAGRFSEAKRVLDRCPDLRIKRQDAATYLRSARARVPEREGVCESEFKRLWELVG